MTSQIADLITLALQEDIGRGDITTQFFVPRDRQGHGRILARESCVIAGTEAAIQVFLVVDPNLWIDVIRKDGARLTSGEAILAVRGAASSILTAERVALNFLQHLSGIATLTHRFVEAVAGYPVKILDTRKTTPGMRELEKAAVVAGGGSNHRRGLYEMVLVKDNHLSASGSIDLGDAIRRVRERYPGTRVEIEADRLDQVRTFLELEGVDIILLDNMSPSEMREAVTLGRKRVQFEASGGVTLQNVGEIAATGVDFISIGALTHSVRAVDLSLELTHEPA
jgi:nicotinate-nucleotide pyrophosphorylase (carboxylating)